MPTRKPASRRTAPSARKPSFIAVIDDGMGDGESFIDKDGDQNNDKNEAKRFATKAAAKRAIDAWVEINALGDILDDMTFEVREVF